METVYKRSPRISRSAPRGNVFRQISLFPQGSGPLGINCTLGAVELQKQENVDCVDCEHLLVFNVMQQTNLTA